jgi:hypothetical protein
VRRERPAQRAMTSMDACGSAASVERAADRMPARFSTASRRGARVDMPPWYV